MEENSINDSSQLIDPRALDQLIEYLYESVEEYMAISDNDPDWVQGPWANYHNNRVYHHCELLLDYNNLHMLAANALKINKPRETPYPANLVREIAKNTVFFLKTMTTGIGLRFESQFHQSLSQGLELFELDIQGYLGNIQPDEAYMEIITKYKSLTRV